jgi:hypothetical protein
MFHTFQPADQPYTSEGFKIGNAKLSKGQVSHKGGRGQENKLPSKSKGKGRKASPKGRGKRNTESIIDPSSNGASINGRAKRDTTGDIDHSLQSNVVVANDAYRGCWALDNVLVVNIADLPSELEEHFDPIDPSHWLFFPGAHVQVLCLLQGMMVVVVVVVIVVMMVMMMMMMMIMMMMMMMMT